MLEKITEATRRIELNVDNLKKIFNLLYNDMFSMVKETTTDYRERTWSRIKSAESAKNISELNDRLFSDISDSHNPHYLITSPPGLSD